MVTRGSPPTSTPSHTSPPAAEARLSPTARVWISGCPPAAAVAPAPAPVVTVTGRPNWRENESSATASSTTPPRRPTTGGSPSAGRGPGCRGVASWSGPGQLVVEGLATLELLARDGVLAVPVLVEGVDEDLQLLPDRQAVVEQCQVLAVGAGP